MKPFLPPDPTKKSPSETSGIAYAGIGLQFAFGIILFLFAGKWIDSRFGTAPIGVILGVFVGAAASFYNVYRQLSAAQKKDDELHHRTITR
ncbi:MAG: AtpZ/AtpI family protein [Gemmatimonadaceae bacterium]